MKQLRSVTGMYDLFEEELVEWRHLEATARGVFSAYRFDEIRTPIVEDVELFVRGVGEGTDIVGKEMFVFSDRDPRAPSQLCLRPENTAGVVRAMIENGKIMADAYWKVFYLGAQFRNERVQAGRHKQFHQLGCEVLGYADPAADVEVIALVQTLLRRLGIPETELLLNSLGDRADRQRYREALVEFLLPKRDRLSKDSQARLETNPLRVLDSKDESDQALCAGAPKTLDFLSAEAKAHFDEVRAGLDRVGIAYTLEPKLVRGLDYYSRTVFEVVGKVGVGAQSAVAGGGRYDMLVEELGGRPTPAVGFAAGIERLLMMRKALGVHATRLAPDLCLIAADDDGRRQCQALAFALRAEGLLVDVDLRSRGVKAQMRHASQSGARLSLVVGSREIAEKRGELKAMATGSVQPIALDAASLIAACKA